MRELILYLVRRFREREGREITLTRLVKLLYLVDLRLRERGLPGLGVRWVRWYYGPFSRDVVREVEALVEGGELREEFLASRSGIIRVFRVRRGVRVSPSPEEAEVMEEVLEEFGGLRFDELIERVYSTFDRDRVDLGEEIPL
mgnify:CR=1 FL=1